MFKEEKKENLVQTQNILNDSILTVEESHDSHPVNSNFDNTHTETSSNKTKNVSTSNIIEFNDDKNLNSKVEIEDDRKKNNNTSQNSTKIEGFGIASMIIAIVGWFLPFGLGLLFMVIALIFAAISISRILGQPDKYRGIGFPITGLILSILGILILLVVASSL